MAFTPNLVVGIVTMLMGVVLLLDRLNLMEASSLLPYWPVALILFGLSLVVQAFRPAGADGTGPRQRPIISPGLVILLVLVWLFASSAPQLHPSRAGGTPEGTIALMGLMSQDTRVSEAVPFRGATMTSVMGGSRLDLRRAVVAPGEEVTIDVFGLMGGVRVDVPADWVVDIQTTVVMGGIQDRGVTLRRAGRGRGVAGLDAGPLDEEEEEEEEEASAAPALAATANDATETVLDGAAGPTGTAPRLVIRGFVMMGGLVIRS